MQNKNRGEINIPSPTSILLFFYFRMKIWLMAKFTKQWRINPIENIIYRKNYNTAVPERIKNEVGEYALVNGAKSALDKFGEETS